MTISSIFNVFRPAKALSYEGFTDWHSHILPGVDDGVETLDDALLILDAYGKAGIKKVWLTPHIMEDMPNSTSFLKERFLELKEAYKGKIELHLAAENMMDNLFRERLASNDLLPIGEDGKTLLVETSYFNPPANVKNIISSILSAGYRPLLAHPERYLYIHDFDKYTELKNMGVLFQLNLMSLSNNYGPEVKQKATRLLQEGYYDLLGSDIHRPAHLDTLCEIRLRPAMTKRVKSLF